MTPWSAGCSLTVALAVLIGAETPQAPDISAQAVVTAAATYVSGYQRQLTSILADEHYTQEIVSQAPPDLRMPRARHMRSEIFFMFAPADHDWMAIRDVVELDGKPLSDRPDLRVALQTLPARDVAVKFKAYNSRYNIGRTSRNFNEPTLSLLVLDDRHRARFSFDRKRVERAGDAILVTVAFAEKDTPTLIRDTRRGTVLSRGELVVEAGVGRVRRTVLTARVDDGSLELATVYSPDPRLGMLVPTLFQERYDQGLPPNSRYGDPTIEHESIFCEAKYTNFRRFATSVRIK